MNLPGDVWEIFVPSYYQKAIFNYCSNARFVVNTDGWTGIGRAVLNADGLGIAGQVNGPASYTFTPPETGFYHISADVSGDAYFVFAQGEETGFFAIENGQRKGYSAHLQGGIDHTVQLNIEEGGYIANVLICLDKHAEYFEDSWLAGPYNSRAIRPSGYTSGEWVKMSDLGFQVETVSGAGVAPTINDFSEYALADGADFNQSRNSRSIIALRGIVGGINEAMLGTTLDQYHTARAAVSTVLASGESVRIRYNLNNLPDASGDEYRPAEIAGYYAGGLEYRPDGSSLTEPVTIQIECPRPVWKTGKGSAELQARAAVAYAGLYELTPTGASIISLPYDDTDRTRFSRRIVSDGQAIYTICHGRGVYRYDGGEWGIVADPSGVIVTFPEDILAIAFYAGEMYGVSSGDLWKWGTGWQGIGAISGAFGDGERTKLFSWNNHLVASGSGTFTYWSMSEQYPPAKAIDPDVYDAIIGPRGNLWVSGEWSGSVYAGFLDKDSLNLIQATSGLESESRVERLAYNGDELWAFGLSSCYTWNGYRWDQRPSPYDSYWNAQASHAHAAGFSQSFLYLQYKSGAINDLHTFDGYRWRHYPVAMWGTFNQLYDIGDRVLATYTDSRLDGVTFGGRTEVSCSGTAAAPYTFYIVNQSEENRAIYHIRDIDSGAGVYLDYTLAPDEILTLSTGIDGRATSSIYGPINAVNDGSNPAGLLTPTGKPSGRKIIPGVARLEVFADEGIAVTAEWDVLHVGLDGGAL